MSTIKNSERTRNDLPRASTPFARMVLRAALALVFSLCAVTSFSQDLPLSVSPSIARPGDTITVTGSGFESGARGLVWAGTVIRGSVDTPGNAYAVSVANGYAYLADAQSGLQVIDASNSKASVIVSGVTTRGQTETVICADGYAYVANSDGGVPFTSRVLVH